MLRRALGNAALLLSGKGAAGILQLATFALAARLLGVRDFGLLSALLAQVQLFVGLATFQSNQAIIRFGVGHLRAARPGAFQALLQMCSLLDLAAAIVAGALVALLAPLVVEWVGGGPDLVAASRILVLLPLASAIATPKGLLRLFGRFDLLARFVVVTPLARLIGIGLVALLGGGLSAILIAWVVAGLVGALVGLALGWREAARRDLLKGMRFAPGEWRGSNSGLLRFAALSNAHSSLTIAPPHIATLAVGALLGPAAAGLMKVAQEIGTALAKPIDLINQAVYPDIARLEAEQAWRRLRRLVFRSGMIAAGSSALVTASLLFLGKPLLSLVFGPAFVAAFPLLMLLSLATSLQVATFAVDPTLYALGRPSRPLIGAAVATTLFAALLAVLVPAFGLVGAGLAYLGGAAATVAMGLLWMALLVPRER